jgi:anthranilate synthase component 2
MIDVFRNDQINVAAALQYDGIVFSPGPGLPDEAGHMKSIIQNGPASMPMLGICLGHQAMAEVYGAKLKNLSHPLHGVELKTSITNPKNPIFKNIPDIIQTGHYHSWVVSHDEFPDCLNIDAIDQADEIMAISHRELPRYGVQFHPESVMTPAGKNLIQNWITNCISIKSTLLNA